MANENRFGNLMSGLSKNSDTEAKPSKQVDGQTNKTPAAKRAKKATTAKTSKASKSKSKSADTTPPSEKSKPKVSRGKETSVGKSKDENYDKVTVYIRSDIAHAMRVVCAHEKAELSGYVEEAVYAKLQTSPVAQAMLDS